MLNFQSRVQRSVGAAFGAGLLLSLVPGTGWCWETAHGPPDNTGFVDVVTKPAEYATKTVGDIGTFVPGAGPVVAPDGTVFIANEQGKLMSFKPDGTPGWSRTIGGPTGQRVLASPAIGSDGSVYVIGVSVSRDHRGGKTVRRGDAFLHVFNSSGAYLGYTAFPEHDGAGGTTASPNIWRFNGTELVIVPALYGDRIRLLAFSQGGGLVVDQPALRISLELVGGFDWWPFDFPAPYDVRPGRNDVAWPLPPVGVYTNPLGGTPFILVSNRHHDLVGFTLSGRSFLEAFRVHDEDRIMRSAPAILPDRHAIIGTEGIEHHDIDGHLATRASAGASGVVFSGPNMNKLPPVTGLEAIDATPTRLPDGRAALIQRAKMVVLDGRNVVKKVPLFSSSRTSASASRTHLFVSTDAAIQTFDPVSLTEVSRMPWSGGGRSQPAIGPTGYVYAIADNTLYVFPPSLKQLPPSRVTPQTGTTVVSTDPGTTTQDSKPYKPPLTMSGNRLFACEELDGDDCGPGDYDTIATAFCKKEGFVGAGHIKVDKKKVKAETLDGRYCSKNKCKVFEQIICANN